jgi:type I restriction enzyme, S subunit
MRKTQPAQQLLPPSDTDLPEGWTQGTVLDLADLIRGVSYSKGEAATEAGPGRIALLRANNIGEGLSFNDLQYVPNPRVSEEQYLRVGDVVLAMSSGSKSVVGKAASVRESWKGTFGAFCGVLRAFAGIDPQYFGLYFQTKDYRIAISELASGTNINNLKREHFANLLVPIAPFNEQKRIAAKAEELLGRSGAALAQLAKLPAILKRFRQSVLDAACSGKLTESWRLSHDVSEPASALIERIAASRPTSTQVDNLDIASSDDLPDGWARTTIGFLAEPSLKGRPYVTSGSRGWARYVSDRGPYFIRSENINTDSLRIEEAVKVSAPAGAEAERTRVVGGDLLLTITGNNVGRTAVVPTDVPAAHVSQHVAIIRTTRLSDVRYLWLWLRSVNHGQSQLEEYFYGQTKPGLNLEQVKSVWVDIPPLEEQREIIHHVDTLFALVDGIENRVRAAMVRAELLPQAILAQAFRGELVDTEAELAAKEGRDYEPAPVLLERVQKSREQNKPAKGRRRGKNMAQHSSGRPAKTPALLA